MPSLPPDPPEPFPHEPVPPILLEWAKQTFDEREHREGVREIRATGGHPLEKVIEEVEARVRES